MSEIWKYKSSHSGMLATSPVWKSLYQVCGGAYISITAGLKSCSNSKHELYHRYFTVIFWNVFKICEYECVMDLFLSEAEIVWWFIDRKRVVI